MEINNQVGAPITTCILFRQEVKLNTRPRLPQTNISSKDSQLMKD